MLCRECGYDMPSSCSKCPQCGCEAPEQSTHEKLPYPKPAPTTAQTSKIPFPNEKKSSAKEEAVLTFEPKYSVTKCITSAITVAIICVVAFFFLLNNIGSSSTEQLVRTGYYNTYPNVKIEDAFSQFFAEPKWSHFTSTGNQQIVEFNGKCQYDNKPATVRLQFTVNSSDNSFVLSAGSINDEPQNTLILNLLLSQVLSSYK